MHITSFYAALFALFFVALSVRTLRLRRRAQIAVGVGDDPLLLRASRVHANFAEYVPLTLLLIALAEAQHSPVWFVHASCLTLAAGRIAHAVGVSRIDEDFRFRVFGIGCTLTVLSVVALDLLVAFARSA